VLWAFLVEGIFGFDMKKVPNKDHVYQILKQYIVDPGNNQANCLIDKITPQLEVSPPDLLN
jgi:hypothetical protein